MEQVRYETQERVAKVTMARPRYRNAQSRQLLRELDEAFAAAMADDGVRVVVLFGEGEAFSAGHDLGTPEQVEDLKASPRRGRSFAEQNFDYSWDNFLDMSLRWRDLPKPTIAAVHGWCIFGGWLVASSMDLIVAADDARFLTNLLQYFTLPWDIGPRKAKQLLLDNRVLEAREAHELGFVNEVWPRDELEANAMEMANRIAGNAAFFNRLAKLSVNQMMDAAGFRAFVQAAHSNYHLSEIHNRLRAAEGGEQADGPRRLGIVDELKKRSAKH